MLLFNFLGEIKPFYWGASGGVEGMGGRWALMSFSWPGSPRFIVAEKPFSVLFNYWGNWKLFHVNHLFGVLLFSYMGEAYGILVPQPGMESMPPTVDGRSLNPWTDCRRSPCLLFFMSGLFTFFSFFFPFGSALLLIYVFRILTLYQLVEIIFPGLSFGVCFHLWRFLALGKVF